MSQQMRLVAELSTYCELEWIVGYPLTTPQPCSSLQTYLTLQRLTLQGQSVFWPETELL